MNLWVGFQRSPEWRTFLNDGLHLSPAGNAALFSHLRAALEAACPELLPSPLKWDFPEHFAIDAKDPAKAFADWQQTRRPANGAV